MTERKGPARVDEVKVALLPKVDRHGDDYYVATLDHDMNLREVVLLVFPPKVEGQAATLILRPRVDKQRRP